MLVLLDENLPHALRLLIGAHDVRTASYQGWNGLSNGVLLSKAEEFGFDMLVTADQSIRYQQNISARRIAVVLLNSNRLEVISIHLALILTAINAAKPGTFVTVDLNPDQPSPPPVP